MIIVNNINLSLDTDFSDMRTLTAKILHTDINNIVSASLYRRSVDARKKNDVHFCCSLIAEAKNEAQLLKRNKNTQKFSPLKYEWRKAKVIPQKRPVIVGFGPAGMFAALTLSKAGLRPIIIERGKAVEKRSADIEAFFSGNPLNPESNIQFGEGGAGTYSDGKLNTGIKDPRCRTVLEEFVRFGAPEKILIDAKPHIGTDILVNVVKNIRKEIIKYGGEILFSSKLEDINIENGKLTHITVNGEQIECEHLILAIGHSARDTFKMLKEKDVGMARKPFSMGVRIEHLQSDINLALYGEFARHPALGAADYKLAVHLPNGRGVYTFCMCPGGEVVNASSETEAIAVNGMSRSKRDGTNANSAVLVNVEPSDIEGDDVLAGCELQRNVERNAYNIGKGAVPTVSVGEFLDISHVGSGKVNPTVKPTTCKANLYEIFPEFIVDSLKQGLGELDKKLHGFADPEAILTAPETRSSSPVRILRKDDGQSISISGLYPCGEGAGYAGGIMSAATDGIKTAEKLIDIIEG